MRPQLASPAAIAVLTSGELPIASPMRRAARVVAAPVTSIVTNFCGALAVAHDLLREIDHHRVERAAETGEPRVVGAGDAAHAAPGRSRTAARVSLVEVSPSTVIELNERARSPPTSSGCSTVAGKLASVKTIGQHRRHVRRDHARALGDAVDAARRRRRSSAVAVAPLGKVSVVMIARAAGSQAVGRQAPAALRQRGDDACRPAAARRSRRSRR